MKNILFAIFAIFMVAPMASAECSKEESIHALALNIYHEARDQGPDGMLMVGEVTMNRVNSRHFPDTICGVVYQGRKDSNGNMRRHQCQFSWYCDGKSDTANNTEYWNFVKDIAEDIVNGEADFLLNDATHYLNPDKVSRMPRWTRVYTNIGRVGDHVFYAMGDRL